MFAPHCPHCQSRVLLGPRRIVGSAPPVDGRRGLVLRCHCGHLVVDDLGAAAPAEPIAPAGPRPPADPASTIVPGADPGPFPSSGPSVADGSAAAPDPVAV